MKKKVLHLLASNSYSGAENVVCNIIDNCQNEYEMYYCSKDGNIREILKQKNIKFISYKKLSIKTLKQIINEYKIDIIHAHDFQASFFASFLNNKCKIISHLHCNYKLLKAKKIVALVYSIVQKRFSKIIAVSNEILEDAPFGNLIKHKTIIVPNVVDSRKVREKSKEFNSKNYDLAFLGRLIEIKQPLFFLEIVNEIKKSNPNIKACIIGDGELYNKCIEKIKQYNLSNNVQMLGFEKNPFPYIAKSKVAVLPSKFEGLPMSVIECMILDTIVVNSGVGGLKDMYEGYEKYICHTMREYVECIVKLLKEGKKSHHLDCQKIVRNYVDINEYSKKIKKIYQDILR